MTVEAGHLCIVGGGPRTLGLIQEIAREMVVAGQILRLVVTVIDPGDLGAGIHCRNQPDYLLTNTLASQVTAFAPINMQQPDLGNIGPNFTDWARTAGYRRVGGIFRVGREGEAVSDLDYLPRNLLGEYLHSAFKSVLAALPKNVSVQHLRQRAVSILTDPLRVVLDDGEEIGMDGIVLCTGHSSRRASRTDLRRARFAADFRHSNPNLCYITNPYPISVLDAIVPGARVGIEGLGLTAFDVIAALTIGRGGIFREHADGSLTYVPSGTEPLLYPFSRSGIPISIRGINQKHAGWRDPNHGVFEDRIAELLDIGVSISFEHDLLPLLHGEMYRAATHAADWNQSASKAVTQPEFIQSLVLPPGLMSTSGIDEYRRKTIDYVRRDVADARLGNICSSRKAATDRIRDCRPGVVRVIESGLLTGTSFHYLAETFNGLANRLAYGPPLRRGLELLALMEAGVLAWGGGPSARIGYSVERSTFLVETPFPGAVHTEPVDVVVNAKVPAESPLTDASPLMSQMLTKGLILPFCTEGFHPSGIAIDGSNQVVPASGTIRPIWALGCLTEGPRYYTHALPRPNHSSVQALEAQRVFRSFLRILTTDKVRA